MRNKGFLILISLVVITVGYAIYDFQSEKKSDEQKKEQSRLIKMDKDQIVSVEISPYNGTSIKLERTSEGWKITAPVQETADQKSVLDFLDAAALELSKEKVKDGGEIDWKIYGLVQPKAILTFTNNSGQILKIDIASKKNFAGDCYLRIEGEDKVYTASTTWINRSEKTPFDFRDKRWLKKSAASIDKLQLKKDNNAFVIENKDGKWFPPNKPEYKLDQVKTSELVYTLNSASALAIVKEGLSASDLKSLGHLKRRATIVANLKGTSSSPRVLLIVSNDKNENYVQTSEPSQVLKINASDADKFANANLDSLRDRHEAFDFDKSSVKKIRVSNDLTEVDFTLKNDDWVLQIEDPNIEYQKERGKSILALIRNFEISDFNSIGGKPLKPIQTVDFLSEQGQAIFQVQFFSTYKKKVDGIEKNYILAKSSSYKDFFGLDESTYRGLGLENLAKKREAKSAASKEVHK